MPSIILSDNGVSSGSAGLKTTAASDGSLVLQTSNVSGTATTAVTIDNSQNMGLVVTPSAWGGFTAFELNGGSLASSSSTNIRLSQNAYYNGTNWIYKTAAASTRYDQQGGAHNWFINTNSPSAGAAITFTQAMTLDASGNLGIGTTSPAAKVTISNGTVNGQFNVDGSGVYVGTINNYPLIFSLNATERARIDSSGNLLVGCTSFPGAGTSTTGAAFGPSYVSVQRAAATACYFGRSNDGEVVALYSGTTQRGTISISGATTTYGSVSDYRLKENIAPITDGLAKVMALKPSTFNFIEFPEQTINGFIAHEVAEVEAIAVVGEKDAVNEEGNPLYQSVDAAKLVPLLTAAIQELKAIVDAQAAEIAALKGTQP